MNGDVGTRLSRAVTVFGVVLLAAGILTQVASFRLGVPLPSWELRFAGDAEFLGVGLWWVAVATRLVSPRASRRTRAPDGGTVHVSRGLVDALLERAADAEPGRESVALAATPARDLVSVGDLSADTPVFTHFVHPGAGRSVRAVFGVDLSTSPRGTQGRFVSHPQQSLSLSKRDDLHEVVFVAVPPWDDDCLAAFDRSGRRLPVRVLDVEPADSLDESMAPLVADVSS